MTSYVSPHETHACFGPQMKAFSEVAPLPPELIEYIFSFLSTNGLSGVYVIDAPIDDVIVPNGLKVIDEFRNIFRVGSGMGGLRYAT